MYPIHVQLQAQKQIIQHKTEELKKAKQENLALRAELRKLHQDREYRVA